MPTNGSLNRKLRMGLVGGAAGSFIGRVHSIAACLDNRATLVAGALSSDPAKAKASAPDYDIPADRAYSSFAEMATSEAKLADKVDFIAVTTPNNSHYAIAKAFCEAGINVVCDKPMTLTLEEAEDLVTVVEKTGVVFAVTHTYTGYPLVRQAREMILAGELGEINAIRAHYIQGWLRTRLESSDQKQAKWRTDPKQSGIAGCWGDIGTHAYNLGRYTTGLLPTEICCQLKTYEGGRSLDDYGSALIRYENGALGTVTASQISHGRENDAYVEIDGTKGSLEWRQENPNVMFVRRNGEPMNTYTRAGGPYLSPLAAASGRIPGGHPEGYFEAFANIYTSAFDAMIERAEGKKHELVNTIYPNVYDGVEGMLFITQSVASSQAGGTWLPFRHPKSRK